jgi:glyoxylase-like metal-dependent hydrolase (beta-lactamase superfamily II)
MELPMIKRSNSFAAMLLLFGGAAAAQPISIQEPAPTTRAELVEPSASRAIQPGQKINKLTTLNLTQPYVLQRLTERTFWFQRQFYGVTFYVGERGVLLFDAPPGRGEHILRAIGEVTNLPVTALAYSHLDATHIGDAKVFVDAAARAGVPIRIVASQAASEKMAFMKSQLPAATDVIAWPNGSFLFEGLKVEWHGFPRAAQTDDHGVWLLVGERVLHATDLINPDQLPFLGFAGNENFHYHEANLRQVLALDWQFMNGAHGNVGTKDDIQFQLQYMNDLRQAVQEASRAHSFASFLDPKHGNSHAAYTQVWRELIAKHATDALRPKYNQYYGFEQSTPINAEMVRRDLGAFR